MLRLVMTVYNDMPLIHRTVNSVLDQVDEIVAVDGRYRDFPSIYARDNSTDGTTEYLESIDKARVIYAAGLGEIEKRNLYLVGEVGDWYLHLDADEEWVGEIEIPQADMLIALMQTRQGTGPRADHRKYPIMKRVRLFRHVEGLHYEKKHYWLYDGSGKTFSLLDKPGSKYTALEIAEVKMLHNRTERDRDRETGKRRYYRILAKNECNIRETT